jgi:hypothetical protein
LTPEAQTRRDGAVKISSPLVYTTDDWDDAATVSTDGNSNGGVRLSVKWEGRKYEKTELQGLGLKFKDPFSSSLGSEFGIGVYSPVDGFTSSIAVSRIPGVHGKGDATSSASPISRSLRVYTPTIAVAKDRAQQAEDTPKRDSLSPVSSKPTASISPTPIPISPHPIFLRMPHHLTPSHTTTQLLPSPKQTHPYTSNTHITPSCTYGALTHRLECGHLILTLKSEVCGRNCVYTEDGEGRDSGVEGKTENKEQGFVANLRDLDDEWVCPCCEVREEMGLETGKSGKRCVSVLGVEKVQRNGRRGKRTGS